VFPFLFNGLAAIISPVRSKNKHNGKIPIQFSSLKKRLGWFTA